MSLDKDSGFTLTSVEVSCFSYLRGLSESEEPKRSFSKSSKLPANIENGMSSKSEFFIIFLTIKIYKRFQRLILES